MTSRNDYLKLLKQNLKNVNLLKHSLAVEVVMKKLAQKFNEDPEKWAVAGLLHDIDYEETKTKPEEHGLIGAQKLESMGFEKDIIEAIKAHNPLHNLPRVTKIAQALYCTDPITGLIVAAALVLPDRKLSSLKVDSILKRFKEKQFARGANRQAILACQELGLTLEEFVKLALEAMQEIAFDLEL